MSSRTLREEKTRILLVEDNPADARLIEIYLEESGFGYWDVKRAEGLNQALEALESQEYGVVLLDLSLPDGPGVANVQKIKSRFPDQNIIVLTGFDERLLGLEAIRHGAQDFLVKGDYDESSLAKTLRFSIERQQFIRRLEETHRMARIGAWEYHPQRHEIVLSDQLLLLTSNNPVGISAGKPLEPFRKLLERIHRIVLSGRKINLDTRLRLHDNTERYVHVQCHLSRNASGEEILQGILQDVTERYLTEEMRKSRDLARKSTEIREQFIASISHEMRTPINAIIGLSNLLMDDALPPEKLQMIRSIKDASDILLGIVNDLLDFSAIRAGKIDFREEPFSLRNLCENLERILIGKLNDRRLDWTLEIDPRVPPLLVGDKLRISQILFNLLGNAIKFTEKGHVGLYVDWKGEENNKTSLLFRIEDTGIGIPEESMQVIFEDFGRVHNDKAFYEGTGLGLAITRQLIEQQKGRIWLESIMNKGTIFFVELTLPLAPDVEPAGLTVNPLSQVAEFHGVILLVEDHFMNQLVARKTIERKWPQAKVLMANNGAEALKILEGSEVDIILMDLQMPVMDGYEATAQIRSHAQERLRNLPVIALTANAYISKDEQFIAKGFSSYILKPFEPETLFETIRHFVPEKQLTL